MNFTADFKTSLEIKISAAKEIKRQQQKVVHMENTNYTYTMKMGPN